MHLEDKYVCKRMRENNLARVSAYLENEKWCVLLMDDTYRVKASSIGESTLVAGINKALDRIGEDNAR